MKNESKTKKKQFFEIIWQKKYMMNIKLFKEQIKLNKFQFIIFQFQSVPRI